MIKTFVIALIFFCIIDVFWIYFVATPMYKQEVASLMQLKIPPAILKADKVILYKEKIKFN